MITSSRRSGLLAAAFFIASLAAAPSARAEEGLFVWRLSGGVATTRATWPDLSGLISASMDLTLGERTGILGSTQIFLGGEVTVLGVGWGIKTLLFEAFWDRIYVHARPEFLIVWQTGEDARWDLGLGAGLGYEHVFMWGFGFVVEVSGTLPFGRGPKDVRDTTFAGATAGLFMEF